MPRYITPGDKVQFFEHTDEGGGGGGGGVDYEEGEALPELTEYTEPENEVTFNSAENEIREYKPTEPPVNVNANAIASASANSKKKSSSKEMFFFFALILIIFGISIFLKR